MRVRNVFIKTGSSILAVALGLIQPAPVHALRATQVAEQPSGGLEELNAALKGTVNAPAVLPEAPFLGPEFVRWAHKDFILLRDEKLKKAVILSLGQWDDGQEEAAQMDRRVEQAERWSRQMAANILTWLRHAREEQGLASKELGRALFAYLDEIRSEIDRTSAVSVEKGSFGRLKKQIKARWGSTIDLEILSSIVFESFYPDLARVLDQQARLASAGGAVNLNGNDGEVQRRLDDLKSRVNPIGISEAAVEQAKTLAEAGYTVAVALLGSHSPGYGANIFGRSPKNIRVVETQLQWYNGQVAVRLPEDLAPLLADQQIAPVIASVLDRRAEVDLKEQMEEAAEEAREKGVARGRESARGRWSPFFRRLGYVAAGLAVAVLGIVAVMHSSTGDQLDGIVADESTTLQLGNAGEILELPDNPAGELILGNPAERPVDLGMPVDLPVQNKAEAKPPVKEEEQKKEIVEEPKTVPGLQGGNLGGPLVGVGPGPGVPPPDEIIHPVTSTPVKSWVPVDSDDRPIALQFKTAPSTSGYLTTTYEGRTAFVVPIRVGYGQLVAVDSSTNQYRAVALVLRDGSLRSYSGGPPDADVLAKLPAPPSNWLNGWVPTVREGVPVPLKFETKPGPNGLLTTVYNNAAAYVVPLKNGYGQLAAVDPGTNRYRSVGIIRADGSIHPVEGSVIAPDVLAQLPEPRADWVKGWRPVSDGAAIPLKFKTEPNADNVLTTKLPDHRTGYVVPAIGYHGQVVAVDPASGQYARVAYLNADGSLRWSAGTPAEIPENVLSNLPSPPANPLSGWVPVDAELVPLSLKFETKPGPNGLLTTTYEGQTAYVVPYPVRYGQLVVVDKGTNEYAAAAYIMGDGSLQPAKGDTDGLTPVILKQLPTPPVRLTEGWRPTVDGREIKLQFKNEPEPNGFLTTTYRGRTAYIVPHPLGYAQLVGVSPIWGEYESIALIRMDGTIGISLSETQIPPAVLASLPPPPANPMEGWQPIDSEGNPMKLQFTTKEGPNGILTTSYRGQTAYLLPHGLTYGQLVAIDPVWNEYTIVAVLRGDGTLAPPGQIPFHVSPAVLNLLPDPPANPYEGWRPATAEGRLIDLQFETRPGHHGILTTTYQGQTAYLMPDSVTYGQLVAVDPVSGQYARVAYVQLDGSLKADRGKASEVTSAMLEHLPPLPASPAANWVPMIDGRPLTLPFETKTGPSGILTGTYQGQTVHVLPHPQTYGQLAALDPLWGNYGTVGLILGDGSIRNAGASDYALTPSLIAQLPPLTANPLKTWVPTFEGKAIPLPKGTERNANGILTTTYRGETAYLLPHTAAYGQLVVLDKGLNRYVRVGFLTADGTIDPAAGDTLGIPPPVIDLLPPPPGGLPAAPLPLVQQAGAGVAPRVLFYDPTQPVSPQMEFWLQQNPNTVLFPSPFLRPMVMPNAGSVAFDPFSILPPYMKQMNTLQAQLDLQRLQLTFGWDQERFDRLHQAASDHYKLLAGQGNKNVAVQFLPQYEKMTGTQEQEIRLQVEKIRDLVSKHRAAAAAGRPALEKKIQAEVLELFDLQKRHEQALIIFLDGWVTQLSGLSRTDPFYGSTIGFFVEARQKAAVRIKMLDEQRSLQEEMAKLGRLLLPQVSGLVALDGPQEIPYLTDNQPLAVDARAALEKAVRGRLAALWGFKVQLLEVEQARLTREAAFTDQSSKSGQAVAVANWKYQDAFARFRAAADAGQQQLALRDMRQASEEILQARKERQQLGQMSLVLSGQIPVVQALIDEAKARQAQAAVGPANPAAAAAAQKAVNTATIRVAQVRVDQMRAKLKIPPPRPLTATEARLYQLEVQADQLELSRRQGGLANLKLLDSLGLPLPASGTGTGDDPLQISDPVRARVLGLLEVHQGFVNINLAYKALVSQPIRISLAESELRDSKIAVQKALGEIQQIELAIDLALLEVSKAQSRLDQANAYLKEVLSRGGPGRPPASQKERIEAMGGVPFFTGRLSDARAGLQYQIGRLQEARRGLQYHLDRVRKSMEGTEYQAAVYLQLIQGAHSARDHYEQLAVTYVVGGILRAEFSATILGWEGLTPSVSPGVADPPPDAAKVVTASEQFFAQEKARLQSQIDQLQLQIRQGRMELTQQPMKGEVLVHSQDGFRLVEKVWRAQIDYKKAQIAVLDAGKDADKLKAAWAVANAAAIRETEAQIALVDFHQGDLTRGPHPVPFRRPGETGPGVEIIPAVREGMDLHIRQLETKKTRLRLLLADLKDRDSRGEPIPTLSSLPIPTPATASVLDPLLGVDPAAGAGGFGAGGVVRIHGKPGEVAPVSIDGAKTNQIWLVDPVFEGGDRWGRSMVFVKKDGVIRPVERVVQISGRLLHLKGRQTFNVYMTGPVGELVTGPFRLAPSGLFVDQRAIRLGIVINRDPENAARVLVPTHGLVGFQTFEDGLPVGLITQQVTLDEYNRKGPDGREAPITLQPIGKDARGRPIYGDFYRGGQVTYGEKGERIFGGKRDQQGPRLPEIYEQRGAAFIPKQQEVLVIVSEATGEAAVSLRSHPIQVPQPPAPTAGLEASTEWAGGVIRRFSEKWGIPLVEPEAVVQELRIVAVTPQIAQADPTLARLIGRPMTIGSAQIVIVPEEKKTMEDLLIGWMSRGFSVTIQEYGAESDTTLNLFKQKAEFLRFTLLERRPLEGQSFRSILRQLVANLAGVEPSVIPESELLEVEQALAVMA
ncbi:MAG: hypothetical protein NC910_04550 [Candidatus Omnitrophica bacterium]|nr:hypothetical protein [Candidatus Omnitrophota bacterium]